MRITDCFRPRDVAITALALIVAVGLCATGREGLVGATSIALVPVYLGAYRYSQRRS